MSGGDSSKAGNNYEAYWGIDKICQLLVSNNDACSIYFENPIKGNNGFEFEVEEDNKKFFYQAKDYDRNWTINKLISDGVIDNFYLKMSENKNYYCTFCTSSDCDLEYYTKEAGKSIDLRTFIKIIPPSRQDKLDDLYKHILGAIKPQGSNITFPIEILEEDDENTQKEKIQLKQKVYDITYDLLKRTKIVKKSISALIDDISRSINFIFKATDVSAIEAGLFHFYNTEFRHKYTKAELIKIFLHKGYEFKEHSLDNSLINKIHEKNKEFVEDTDSFCKNFLIEREEVNQIFSELLNDGSNARHIFITGDAGYGKSIVLKEVIKNCIQAKIDVISFDIKNYSLTSLDNLGEILYSKHDSPVSVLNDIAQHNKAIIFIDQLDSLSTVSGRHTENWDVINKLLKESIKYPNIKVVLACRKFDLEKDTRLREFQKSFKNNIERFEVKKLSESQVKSTLINLGVEETKITPNSIKLFSVPLHLSLLYEIIQEKQNIELNYNSIVDLYDEFWDTKKASTQNWYNVIELMVDSLCENKSISIISEKLSKYDDDVDKMISANIFTLKYNQIAFFHETFFDYCFARLLLSNQDRNLLNFILESGQSLFIRSNVRQALEYLKIKDEDSYNKYFPKSLSRLEEYKRKFKVATFFIKPSGINGGWVAPPIKNESAEKMNDEQWINAINEYESEHGKEFLKGGAIQLSRVLEKETQNNPVRFLNLAYNLDVEKTNYHYFSAILNGLCPKKNMFQEKIDFIRYCYRLNREVLARDILGLLHSIIEHNEFTLSEEILEMVEWFGTNHNDPRRDDIDNDVDLTAINCVRGKVSEVIRDLLWKDYSFIGNLLPIIQNLINDTIPVRAITSLTLLPIYNQDKNLAYELFYALININEEIFKSHYVQEFLDRTRNIDTYELQNNIFENKEYTLPEVQQYIAIVYCIYAIWEAKYEEKAKTYINNVNINYRIGSAKALSYMIQKEEHSKSNFARESLMKLLNDNEVKVQESADDFINRRFIVRLLDDSSLLNQYMDTLMHRNGYSYTKPLKRSLSVNLLTLTHLEIIY